MLGAAILAFGLFNVHQQSRITEGGVLGATLLLQHWLGISPAISEVVMDVACYLLGIKYLGKGFLRYSLVATGGFAVFYALFARMGYLLPSMAHLPLLAAVVGGLFVGLGAGRWCVPVAPREAMTHWRWSLPSCSAGRFPGPTCLPTWLSWFCP